MGTEDITIFLSIPVRVARAGEEAEVEVGEGERARAEDSTYGEEWEGAGSIFTFLSLLDFMNFPPEDESKSSNYLKSENLSKYCKAIFRKQ